MENSLNKNFLAALSLCFSCLLSCGSDPTSPEISSLHIANYFPLIEGYSQRYTYYYEVTRWEIDASAVVGGYCEVKVTKVFQENNHTYASVLVSFNMTDGNEMSFRDTTFSRAFDIMQTPDTIWYVVDAPSLDRLNEGTRIPMMFSQREEGNYLDLSLFALDLGAFYKYKDELKFHDAHSETTGKALKYTIDTFGPDPSVRYNVERSTITLVLDEGIRSIDAWKVAHMSLTHGDYVKVRMELIE